MWRVECKLCDAIDSTSSGSTWRVVSGSTFRESSGGKSDWGEANVPLESVPIDCCGPLAAADCGGEANVPHVPDCKFPLVPDCVGVPTCTWLCGSMAGCGDEANTALTAVADGCTPLCCEICCEDEVCTPRCEVCFEVSTPRREVCSEVCTPLATDCGDGRDDEASAPLTDCNVPLVPIGPIVATYGEANVPIVCGC